MAELFAGTWMVALEHDALGKEVLPLLPGHSYLLLEKLYLGH